MEVLESSAVHKFYAHKVELDQVQHVVVIRAVYNWANAEARVDGRYQRPNVARNHINIVLLSVS